DHDHDHDHEDGEKEYDEHVWLSLRNASALVKHIAESLKKIDSSHADVYTANASAYTDKLKALDAEYQKAVDGSTVRTLLFGDRFPFRYLADDYGLTYYAAFVGCSAESEASFETITFLSKKVDELGLPAVLTIEGANHKIAETVVRNTQNGGQKILSLDSMQSVTAKDVKDGASYLAIMEKNLEVLKEALK
ncbi:MAG: zinc ABC transporter substrate-binding protein, partial [Lachnospiraceae bacterium]|nr:zinc ABC transporter substrate-binding protein [Lachnospiraceae bacterium]